jgi:hypothetical protein
VKHDAAPAEKKARELRLHQGLFEAFDAALRLVGNDYDALEELLKPARKLPKRSACAPVPTTKRSKRTKISSPP